MPLLLDKCFQLSTALNTAQHTIADLNHQIDTHKTSTIDLNIVTQLLSKASSDKDRSIVEAKAQIDTLEAKLKHASSIAQPVATQIASHASSSSASISVQDHQRG